MNSSDSPPATARLVLIKCGAGRRICRRDRQRFLKIELYRFGLAARRSAQLHRPGPRRVEIGRRIRQYPRQSAKRLGNSSSSKRKSPDAAGAYSWKPWPSCHVSRSLTIAAMGRSICWRRPLLKGSARSGLDAGHDVFQSMAGASLSGPAFRNACCADARIINRRRRERSADRVLALVGLRGLGASSRTCRKSCAIMGRGARALVLGMDRSARAVPAPPECPCAARNCDPSAIVWHINSHFTVEVDRELLVHAKKSWNDPIRQENASRAQRWKHSSASACTLSRGMLTCNLANLVREQMARTMAPPKFSCADFVPRADAHWQRGTRTIVQRQATADWSC